MEASTHPENEAAEQPETAGDPTSHIPDEEEAVKGEQGQWLEQDPGLIGRQADGSVRMNAPPPGAQSGVPLAADRAAGVEAGEKGPVTPERVPGAPGGVEPPEEGQASA